VVTAHPEARFRASGPDAAPPPRLRRQQRHRADDHRRPDRRAHAERLARNRPAEDPRDHHGSRKIVAPSGEYVRPILFAVLDDRSWLICHAQGSLDETARNLVHGVIQAFPKRSLPRSLMTTARPFARACRRCRRLVRDGHRRPTLR
jgi:hypothetical protein